jgi:hypothetical protein
VSHADSRAGATLQGRYRVHGLIAEGAMGSVYRGERLGLLRPVAIKFLRADLARDPAFVKRFQGETRALGRLCHPHCVSVIDHGVEGEVPYLVMDFVEGRSLRALLASGPLPPRRAVDVIRQVLSALAHAHARGIVHRDVKPENILLDGGPGIDHDHVRVLDFGLSKLVDETSQLTEKLMIGTPCYMAPEQFQPGEVDGRADVYACGVLLYELLTGVNPFEGASLNDTAVAHRFMSVRPPRNLPHGRRLSPALLGVLGRALAKAPDGRFPSAAAMMAALDAAPERASTPAAPVVRARMVTRLRALARRVRAVAGRVRPLARWPYDRRTSASVLAAFAFAFVVVFALTLSARPRGQRSAAVALARPAPGPTELTTTPAPRTPSSEADLALTLARQAFEQHRFGDGLDYFRFATRRDRLARGNAVLVDHVIDGLASDRLAPRAEAFLRELGRDARPHVQNAARTHESARVRQRAQALLAQGRERTRPFLRWIGHRPPPRRG